MLDLSFRNLPVIAVSSGDTAPVPPDGAGVWAWSSTLNLPVYWDAAAWHIAGSNTIAPTLVTLDFGAVPVFSKPFIFTDANVLKGNLILMAPFPSTVTGTYGVDEMEMDGFACAAYSPNNGIIRAYITAVPGPVTGQRKFLYQFG